jgi:hypothetical protein
MTDSNHRANFCEDLRAVKLRRPDSVRGQTVMIGDSVLGGVWVAGTSCFQLGTRLWIGSHDFKLNHDAGDRNECPNSALSIGGWH